MLERVGGTEPVRVDGRVVAATSCDLEDLVAREAQAWPGSVRELENFLQRALILSPGSELALPELPTRGARTAVTRAVPDEPARSDDAVRDVIERTLRRCGGRIYGPGGAPEVLGLRPTTLQGKMRKYGISSGPRAG